MTTLNLSSLTYLLQMDLQTFKDLHAIDQNPAAYYYAALKAEANAAGLLHVENYADLAYEVVTDGNINGQLANNYTEQFANAVSLDFSAGSDARLKMQHELMKADLSARLDKIANSGSGELNYQDTNDIHSTALDAIGLPPEAFSLYTPLSSIGATNPAEAQFVFQTAVDGDGFIDVLQDAVLLGIATSIDANQSISDVLTDYEDQAEWLTAMNQATQDFVAEYGGVAATPILGILEFFEALSRVAGGTFDIFAGWTGGNSSVLDALSEKINDLVDIFGLAETRASPLIFDLNANSAIDLSAYATTNDTFFDLDNDGFAERTGWVDATDGILVYDQNENGRIENTSEWFGTKDTDGFTILAAHDSNSDGQIDSNDDIWEDLQIWQDADQDGISDAGELFTLADHDIVSISLASIQVEQTNEGHHVSHTGTFIVDDGVSAPASRIVHDIWFTYDDVASRYAQSYTFDMRAAYLPTVRGYGELADLHIAMSLDNSGTGNLLDLVTDFNELSLADLFDGNILGDVRAIAWRWAEVDDLTGDERLMFVDSRNLGFLEKLTGQPYLQLGHYSNPLGPDAGRDLNQAFFIAINHIYSTLVLQTAGESLFDGDFFYNVSTDSFEDITGLNATALDDLETAATALTTADAKKDFWVNVARVIDSTLGIDNLSSGDEILLDDAIYDSSGLDLVSHIIPAIPFVTSYNGLIHNGSSLDDVITGTVFNDDIRANAGNDTVTAGDGTDYIDGNDGNDDINGGGNDDIIDGGNGDDILTGGSGNDTISGDAGDDTLEGGTGGDFLEGGLGEDIYTYNLGDGNDVIDETGNGSTQDIDKIVMGSGIDSGDITIARSGSSDLLISIDTGTEQAEILLIGHFYSSSTGGHVEFIEFSDSSTYALDTQTWTTYGTSSAETLYGSNGGGGSPHDLIYGEGGADIIYGGVGDDIIHGGSVNDSIYGGDDDDEIYGYAGNDALYGGSGNDTLVGGTNSTINNGRDYLHGEDGDDLLEGGFGDDSLNGGAGTDTAVYDVDSDDFIIYRETASKYVVLDTGDLSKSTGYGEDALYDVEYIQFNDVTVDIAALGLTAGGSVWGSSAPIYGTAGNDNISGYVSADTIYAYSGNDTVSGRQGADVIYGEDGNDTLRGWDGNDTLNGGSGTDTIYGGYGDDEIYGGDSGTAGYWDALYGEAGDDTIEGGLGHDRIWGGDGTDTIVYNVNSSGFIVFRDNAAYIKVQDTNDLSSVTGYGIDQIYTGAEYIQFNDVTIDLSVTTFTIGDVPWGTTAPMNGTSSGETISGFATNDVIYGLGGNDTLNGNAGFDSLYGGDGNDTLNGGDGNDILHGNAGTDNLNGGAGDDVYVFDSSWGGDIITDTGGEDKILIQLSGLTASDFIFAPSTDRIIVLDAATGANVLFSVMTPFTSGVGLNASPVETIEFNDGSTLDLAGPMTWEGNSGNNTLHDYASNGVMYGYAGNDTMSGHDGNDTLYGGNNNDILYGGDDDDTLYGEAGTDTLNGDAGADTLYGGTEVDTLNGGEGNDTLYGEAGNDNLNGGNGNDALHGGAGTDTLTGGSGDDIYVFDSNWGGDIITDTSGTDKILIQVSGWTAADFIFAPSTDRINVLDSATGATLLFSVMTSFTSGAGLNVSPVETIEFADASTLNLAGPMTWEGNYGNNTMHDYALNGIMYGYAGADAMSGHDGNDTLYGGDGNDTLNGGDDNDTLYGEAGNDTLNGDAGNDSFVYSAGLDTVSDTSGTDTLLFAGTTTINDVSFSNVSTYNTKITLSSGTNEITVVNLRHGTAANHVDYIAFSDGFTTSLPDYASWLNGTSGNDTVAGNGNDNTMIGFAGNDTMTGGAGSDDMHGGAGNDTLDGDDGSDLLYGGDGDDILYGEGGLDTLHGGAGADTFKFFTASAFSDVDVIRDFSAANDDALDLTDILDTTYDPLADDIADFISFSESSGSTFVSIDLDGTGGTYSMAQIAKLENVTGLSDPDTLITNGNLVVNI